MEGYRHKMVLRKAVGLRHTSWQTEQSAKQTAYQILTYKAIYKEINIWTVVSRKGRLHIVIIFERVHSHLFWYPPPSP